MAPQGRAQFTKDWDFYYDMSYSVAYSTFANLPAGNCFYIVFLIDIAVITDPPISVSERLG